MNDDIVARLREEGFVTHMARLPRESKILHAAADEIERLRNDLDGSQLAYRGASYDRNRMRAERDEARREVCELVAMMTKQQLSTAAKQRGWDCFRVKDADEWQMERMREALKSLPWIPTCKEDKK